MRRLILGEGYAYPAYTGTDPQTHEESFGVKLVDAEGLPVTLDRAAILGLRGRVRLVVELLEDAEEDATPRLPGLCEESN